MREQLSLPALSNQMLLYFILRSSAVCCILYAGREVLRLAGPASARDTVGRGPELTRKSFLAGKLTLGFSNTSLHVHAGEQVPPPAGGCSIAPAGTATSPAVLQEVNGVRKQVRTAKPA